MLQKAIDMHKSIITICLVAAIAVPAFSAPIATSQPAQAAWDAKAGRDVKPIAMADFKPSPAAQAPEAAKPAPISKVAAPALAQGDALKTTVVSVTGSAQKLSVNGANKWEELKAGDVLDEKTLVRTGFNSKVVLQLADRGEFTLDGAAKVGISELRKQGDLVKGAVGIKYGNMHASIDSSKGGNEFQVSTPVATLTVRGSSGNIGFFVDAAANMRFQAQSGHWVLGTSYDRMTFGPGDRTNTGGVGVDSTFVGLLRTMFGGSPIDFGATPSERNAAAMLGAFGGGSGWAVINVSTLGATSAGYGAPPTPGNPPPSPNPPVPPKRYDYP